VLDEPTNGLDPPQISAMREVLRRYGAEGRTVLLSSHLLAEVEQTCTDVVVMHHGRVVAAGPVREITAGNGSPGGTGVAVSSAGPHRRLEDAFLDLIGGEQQ
jgi:ABC-2 type transport system ATP-binding protein